MEVMKYTPEKLQKNKSLRNRLCCEMLEWFEAFVGGHGVCYYLIDNYGICVMTNHALSKILPEIVQNKTKNIKNCYLFNNQNERISAIKKAIDKTNIIDGINISDTRQKIQELFNATDKTLNECVEIVCDGMNDEIIESLIE